ncbi:MAG: hypothetical protein J6U19_06350 [Oscillospiraceae bacterium]|nr:hypothetical protein [Oscillospiraceae bacterium]
MIMKLISWVLSLIFAFSLGAGVRSDNNSETSSELQQKVQDHMDVIVDEAAAIVDEVTAEIRQNEHVQEAEAFADDVKEIVNNTVDDIRSHFGPEEEAAEADAETAEEVPAEAPAEAAEEQAGA